MAENTNDFEFANEQARKQAEGFNDALERSNDAAAGITQRIGRVLEKMADTSDSAERFLSALSGINDLTSKQADLQEKVYKGQITGGEAQKIADQAREKVEVLEQEYNAGIKGSKKLKKADKEALQERIKGAKQFANVSQKAADAAKLGDKSKLVKGTEKFSKLIKAFGGKKLAGSMDKAAKSMRGAAAQGEKMGGQMKNVAKDMKKSTNLLKKLVNMMVAVAKASLKVNQEVTSIGRGLGISTAQARNVRRNLLRISQVSGDIAVNFKTVTKTFGELNKAFGTASMAFRTELLATATSFRERMGLSAQATAELVKLSHAQGKQLKANTIEAIGAIKAVEKERGVRFDIKGILEETAKVSGLVKAQLGGSLENITEAIAKAKAWGAELNTIVSASKQLLNFEQSINDEFTAEVLLGKDINLNRARLLSLTGEYGELAEELKNQSMDFLEFSKLNVIQAEAYAKALGMSADTLGDILLQNENLNSLMEQARAEGDAQTLQRLQQLSTQEKFNYAIQRLKDALIGLIAYLERTKIFQWLMKQAESVVVEGGELIYKDPGTVGGGITNVMNPYGAFQNEIGTPQRVQQYGNQNQNPYMNAISQQGGFDYKAMADANVQAFANVPIKATIGRFENTSAFNYNQNNLNLNNLEA